MPKHVKALLAVTVLLIIGSAGCFLNPSDFFGGGGGPSITAVNPTPANPTIAIGAKQTFVANATLSNGTTTIEGESQTSWSSSDTTVATIDASGVATGLAVGKTTIKATVKSVSGTTVLTVIKSSRSIMSVRGSYRVLTVTFSGAEREFVFAGNALDDTISVSRVLASGGEERAGTFSSEPSRGPLWLAVDSSGRFLYVTNQESRDVSGYSIDPVTGRLSPVIGSPFPIDSAVEGPWAISVDPTGHFAEVTQLNSTEVRRYRIDPLIGTLSLDESSR